MQHFELIDQKKKKKHRQKERENGKKKSKNDCSRRLWSCIGIVYKHFLEQLI